MARRRISSDQRIWQGRFDGSDWYFRAQSGSLVACVFQAQVLVYEEVGQGVTYGGNAVKSLMGARLHAGSSVRAMVMTSQPRFASSRRAPKTERVAPCWMQAEFADGVCC
ncbi:hypothetical protein BU25DRAFT_106415 [Macroventuria anomochaeta]|uniref:Uncharacterized protein n=1 Tax=Macroventuria anomochaeta TaxID=301207 RepID=A0ACB6RXT9_9PLEO|nr:uncharacterized protein BU25DRAFT_106415 [Macroventuria anomochaeta]KAF2625964.1 hypothetical protein BU25DRAFT_106415 [Macroventuria anomochaeta]